MIAMANDVPVPTWRNFAAWSAAGAGFYVLIIWGATALLHQDVMDSIVRPTKVTAELGLAMLFSMAVAGFSNRKRPPNLRNVRNFLILNAMAVIAFMLGLWAFSVSARAGAFGAMGVSEWVAGVTGAILVVVAVLGSLVSGSAHTRLNLIDDESVAEEMRERGRLIFYSFIWMAACGSLLIVLALSGRAGVLSPPTALAGVLVLIGLMIVLGIVTWRLSDELGRTLARETGTMAFYLILGLGGGWSMLARLGFVAALAPLDWLTLFTLLLYAAAFIAAGRRKLLTR